MAGRGKRAIMTMTIDKQSTVLEKYHRSISLANFTYYISPSVRIYILIHGNRAR